MNDRGWHTWATTSGNATTWGGYTNATGITIDGPTTISIAPTKSKSPKSTSPLEWLRDQIDEICGLAFAP